MVIPLTRVCILLEGWHLSLLDHCEQNGCQRDELIFHVWSPTSDNNNNNNNHSPQFSWSQIKDDLVYNNSGCIICNHSLLWQRFLIETLPKVMCKGFTLCKCFSSVSYFRFPYHLIFLYNYYYFYGLSI